MGPIIFAFGPNGRCMISNGTNRWWSDLPEQLYEAIGSNARNVDNFVACAFGPDEQHFMTFRQRGGKITQRRHHLPSKLNDWLYRNSRYTRNLETLRVVLGPNNSFFAMDKNGLRWDGVPPKLDQLLQESMTLEGWKSPPKVVALGIDGTFILVDWKGNIKRDLQGRYDDLEKYLSAQNTGQDIEFISLDALHGKYYFVKKKGGRKYWVSPMLEKLMPDFLRGLTDSAAIAPRSVETVLADKKQAEAETLSQKLACEALEAKLKEAEKRLTVLRKDLLLRKREWKEKNDDMSKELSSVRSATAKVASKAIAMTNERISYDASLREEVHAALESNEEHSQAMTDLNNQFVQVMKTVPNGT